MEELHIVPSSKQKCQQPFRERHLQEGSEDQLNRDRHQNSYRRDERPGFFEWLVQKQNLHNEYGDDAAEDKPHPLEEQEDQGRCRHTDYELGVEDLNSSVVILA